MSNLKEKNRFLLRDIHVDVENIYEDIKANKSQFVYRSLFLVLFVASIIVFITHIYKNGFSYSTLFLIFILSYYFYHTYKIKQAKKEYIKIQKPEKIDPENSEFLKERIEYVYEGVLLILFRAKMTRNFYMIFFPLLTITLTNLMKVDLSLRALLSVIMVSLLLGGLFWYYYFRVDIEEINEDIYILEKLKNKINNIN